MISRKTALLTLAISLLAISIMAQVDDKFGAIDTVYAEPYQINARNWAINVSMFNDEEIVAISIPLTFSAGTNRVVADSTVFEGGRAEQFRVKYAVPDTASQTLTIGLLADLGLSVPPIPPGKGRIATIFISSIDQKDITSLKVDSTTTPPSNSLLLVKQPAESITPYFIVKQGAAEAKSAVKEEKK
jgi:hypothetical protein